MPSTEAWTLTIISNVIHASFIMVIIMLCIRFYGHKQSQALQKRYPLLVFFMSLGIILYLLQHTLYKVGHIYEPVVEYFDMKSIGNIFHTMSFVLYCVSMHGMIIMLIARSWLIYFNTKYSHQMQVC